MDEIEKLISSKLSSASALLAVIMTVFAAVVTGRLKPRRDYLDSIRRVESERDTWKEIAQITQKSNDQMLSLLPKILELAEANVGNTTALRTAVERLNRGHR